jgi:hypothetical protein
MNIDVIADTIDTCADWLETLLDEPAHLLREMTQECIFELQEVDGHEPTLMECISVLDTAKSLIDRHPYNAAAARKILAVYYHKLLNCGMPDY